MSTLDALWRLHNDPSINPEDLQLNSVDISADEGQTLQLQLLERWLEQGEEIGGWKIGMTSGANRNAMGDGIRPTGFILKSRIYTSGSKLPLSQLHNGQVENELAIRMGADLGGDATREDAIAAVDCILPGFEINQKRLPPGADTGLRVADNLSNYGIVVGTGVKLTDDLVQHLNQMTVTLADANGTPIETVASENHIDDHFESLAILARRLDQFGQSLKAGQYVITGAYGKTPFAQGTYRGHFDQNVGDVEICLA